MNLLKLILRPLMCAGTFAAVSGGLAGISGLPLPICDEGCTLGGTAVCGTDGEWYQNKCIALCAGVSLDASGTMCTGTCCLVLLHADLTATVQIEAATELDVFYS
jgi:hypothetical protein